VTGSPAIPRRRLLVPTLPELWAFLAIALPVVAALVASMSTVDLAYAVRAGRQMLDTRTLMTTDSFTFTVAGQPWFDQQWLAQVLLGGAYAIGGWALLAALRAALVGVLFGLVLGTCRLAGAPLRPAAGLTLASFVVSAVGLALRPQLVAMVLFALTLWLLAMRRGHPRWVWALPVIVALWANLHGSFFLGPLAVGFAWLEDRRSRRPGADRLLIVALVSATATLLNPWGIGVWSYAVSLSVSPTIRSLLVEWQATSPLAFVGSAFYLSLAAVVGAILLVARRSGWRSMPWPALLWLAVLAAIGMYAQRGVVWWAIGTPSVVAGLLFDAPAPTLTPTWNGTSAPVAPHGSELRSPANLAVALVICAIGVLALPWWRAEPPNAGVTPLLTDAPEGVTHALLTRAKPGDRLFAPQQLGSWFEFAAPSAPVFVDSRVELFPASIWDDYLAAAAGGANGRSILDRWHVTLVATTPDALQPLTATLRSDASWSVLYDAADGTVFARR
jgi:hypothetical protein